MDLIVVMVGAFFGAMARFGIGQLVKKWSTSVFPWATLFVNVSGSFLLGYLVNMTVDYKIVLGLGVGFLGSFTTFSTFKLEVMRFVAKDWIRFGMYLLATYVLGLVAAYLGYHLA
ncbi:fluoride efflux transporter FluC [Exiguobacterium aurantiacum]|uniref:Fluoride-specific ion channel FluC n=1 Tax=Exiguobacterium aurantiacum TaxID=33987 RepID=A0ABY5FLF2_9BACL|nr:CrcB family protein [Exiguobacterium aurantiacum]UTT42425.1 CrcB family protein [Exiguobacterium aurantiacum]